MNWINVGILLLKLCTSFVYSKAEEKHWLGPTRCIWQTEGPDRHSCNNSVESCPPCNFLDTGNKKNLDDCKLACAKNESCNAIIFKEDSVASQCVLGDCESPVPVPPLPANGTQGYYRGTADENVKCPDMNVVELGSKQCNIANDSKTVAWNFYDSWDEGQNCLCGCIFYMKKYKWEDACCEAIQLNNKRGTECRARNLADVIKGDENSTETKAVNCKVEPLTDTQASSNTSKTSTTGKLDSTSTSILDSTSTSTTDMSATKNQINPEDPDDGADSGSSTCKLNGKKKTFLMIHVTITQILLMLLVIIHKNV